jgi:hypothetical protein
MRGMGVRGKPVVRPEAGRDAVPSNTDLILVDLAAELPAKLTKRGEVATILEVDWRGVAVYGHCLIARK